MTTIPIPAAALQAAAKAIESTLMSAGLGPALELRDAVFTGLADAALAAAFGVGEIRQQWRVQLHGRHSRTWTEHPSQQDAERALAGYVDRGFNGSVQSRYVLSVSEEDGWTITTAWRNAE